MLSALYAIARPSVGLVCLSDGRIEKRLKLGLQNFHHTVSLAFL